jgi:hypothetical protein
LTPSVDGFGVRGLKPLAAWLASDACHRLDGAAFIAALGRLLAKPGIPIHHLAFHIRALNPTLFGRSFVFEFIEG